MTPFKDIPEALQRTSAFLIASGASLPSELQAALSAAVASPSPVDRIVQFGKAIHERREGLSVEARTIAAEAIEFAARFGWHGLASEGPGLLSDLTGEA